MLESVATTSSGRAFISTAASIGPLACSIRSAARPSQNWATLNTELNTVGAFRGPFWKPCPIEVGTPSTPPMPMLWQLLQLITPLEDSRPSNHSCRPRSTLAGVTGLPSGSGARSGIGLKIACARAIRSSTGGPSGCSGTSVTARPAAGSTPSAAWRVAPAPIAARAESPPSTPADGGADGAACAVSPGSPTDAAPSPRSAPHAASPRQIAVASSAVLVDRAGPGAGCALRDIAGPPSSNAGMGPEKHTGPD